MMASATPLGLGSWPFSRSCSIFDSEASCLIAVAWVPMASAFIRRPPGWISAILTGEYLVRPDAAAVAHVDGLSSLLSLLGI
jgi:hypothetical protein